jgi:cGMP-dependent protein kinase 2
MRPAYPTKGFKLSQRVDECKPLELGTECALFAKDKVPKNLLKDPRLSSDHTSAYTRTFIDSNLQMHRGSVDDSMSGTTAIVARIKGRSVHVCNVGDSRATLGEVNSQGRLRAVDLSHDQTPFRDDECQRVKAAGARVLTLDQLEGLKDQNIKCWAGAYTRPPSRSNLSRF